MATFSQKDNQLLYVGQDAAKSTAGISSLNDGEIGIFTPSGTRLTEASAATAEKFIIVKKTPAGGIELVSSVIDKTKIKSATRASFVPAVDQISTVGFDGATGSIDVINDNEYHVRISMRQGRTSNHGGLYLKHGFYVSDVTATEFEIASNLLVSLNNEFSKEPDKMIVTEMLSDDAGAAIVGATFSVVEGSHYILSDIPGHGLVPGDAIRLGGLAVTDAVYVVETVNAETIKLTSRYTGATAAGLAGESLTALTGAFGLRLTGQPQPRRVGKLHSDLQPIIFDLSLEGFGVTPLMLPVTADAGNGTEKQVAELEFFLQGNEGDYFRMGEPNIFDSRSEVSGDYNLIHVVTEELYSGSIVSGPIHKVQTLALPIPTPAYAATATADDITDVLEVLAFGSVTGDLDVG